GANRPMKLLLASRAGVGGAKILQLFVRRTSMHSRICDLLGIEFPLLASSHCCDVVSEVSRAGGFGVFGAVSLPPDRLEEELRWIDDHVSGKPYGVDLIVPNKVVGKGQSLTTED